MPNSVLYWIMYGAVGAVVFAGGVLATGLVVTGGVADLVIDPAVFVLSCLFTSVKKIILNWVVQIY
ncbi:MAG: hypothetical protein KZQ89_20180 [Candidatus Thiodiazotropha sp. (ex Lucinoma kastoroae)]|nr:hypothetical protein [Candidatus Thiodiazotropha sp. (ex Lucinoma kastoroae)]